MAISERSVDRLADSLSEEFNSFVTEYYDQQLSELFADAAVLFVDSEFGPTDGDFASELALRLVQRQYVSTDADGGLVKF